MLEHENDVAASAPAPAPRKRGRPRTLTDEQQIPERRRKQLRVAQQAYRKRKETTINNLQSRVGELESGVEELSRSFLAFSNLLFEAQVLQGNPHITAALQEITKLCVSLAKDDQDAPESTTSVDIAETASTSPLQELKEISQITHAPYDPSLTQDNVVMVNNIYPPSGIHGGWSIFQTLPPTPPCPDQTGLPFGLVLSSPNPPPQISPPVSSGDYPTNVVANTLPDRASWTLAHRLVRQCCENGYRLLTRAAGDEPRVQAVFGKRLTNSERNRLISEFFAIIQDEFGEQVELKTRVFSVDHRRRNPCPAELQATSSDMWQKVQDKGLEGWLDANEVQKLLQDRGLRLHDTNSPPSTMPSHDSQWLCAPQLNITNFVELLCHLGANCLGRGPVFPRSRVERALQMSMSDGLWTTSTEPSMS